MRYIALVLTSVAFLVAAPACTSPAPSAEGKRGTYVGAPCSELEGYPDCQHGHLVQLGESGRAVTEGPRARD
jgi:hypothetical protein